MQKINARRTGKGKVRGLHSDPPEHGVEGLLDASTHVPEAGSSVPPAQGKKQPAEVEGECAGAP